MKFRKVVKFVVLVILAALLPLLIGQQPLSDAQLRQIIADWLDYPIEQIQFEDLGTGGISWFIVVSASDPIGSFSENQVQDYEVTLPNGITYSISIDRFTGMIYKFGHLVTIEGLTIDRMLQPNQAIALARQYLQKYYIWADTSNWEIKEIIPEVKNGQWTKVEPMISVDFEPPLQTPQLPEGVVFVNYAIYCSITIDAVNGDFVGFCANYSQVDFPLEPIITPEEAKSIARQYLISKGIQAESSGYWVSMGLVPDLETTYARLVYFFLFPVRISPDDDLYITASIGIDSYTGEVVYYEK